MGTMIRRPICSAKMNRLAADHRWVAKSFRMHQNKLFSIMKFVKKTPVVGTDFPRSDTIVVGLLRIDGSSEMSKYRSLRIIILWINRDATRTVQKRSSQNRGEKEIHKLEIAHLLCGWECHVTDADYTLQTRHHCKTLNSSRFIITIIWWCQTREDHWQKRKEDDDHKRWQKSRNERLFKIEIIDYRQVN